MNKFLIFILLSITLLSCEKDPKDEQFIYYRVRVNHYQQAVPSKFVHLIQTDKNIGTANWQQENFNIENFIYEPGYVYELDVMKFSAPNSPNTPQGIKLKKTISKTSVNEQTVFEINLKLYKTNLLTAKAGGGYKILNKIDLECDNLCNELKNALSNYDNVIAKVLRNKDGTYQLISLSVN